MKLRNKKTGEIGRLYFDHQLIDPKTGTYAIVIQHRDKLGYEAFANYFTLAELNAEWEDYKPAEPLIKDEKVCKAVRAWAEANGVTSIVLFDCNNGVCLKINEMEFAENGGRASISFNTSEKIDTSKAYTIAELCGEEEK